MNGENVVGFVIFFMVALVMEGVGIAQRKGKNPVGFYTGEEPPQKEELSDWEAWNKKHGMMWMLYGVVIMLGYLAGVIIRDDIFCAIVMGGGVIVPLPIMIWYHHRLINRYKK